MALYQVLTQIIVQQVTPFEPPGKTAIARNKRFVIPYLHSYDGESSWENICQRMTIILPKNVKFYEVPGTATAGSPNNGVYSFGSINTKDSNIGGYVGSDNTARIPTLMRGDMITLNVGYRAKLSAKDGSEVTYMTGGPDPTGVYPNDLVLAQPGIPPLFQGFISRVSPRLPVTVECEDAMWLLSQIPTPKKQWPGSNIPKIADEILKGAAGLKILERYAPYGVNLSVSKFSQTNLVFNIQNFWTRGLPLDKELARVRHQYKLYSWFRGYELRIGLTTYVPGDAVTHKFTFQQNILDNDNLSLKRKDDVVLSATVTAHYAEETGNTTKDGQKVTRARSTRILVYNQEGSWKYIESKKGVEFPPNDAGCRYDFNFFGTTVMDNGATIDVTKPENLFQMGVRYLKRRYYDGLTGSFTTLGVPSVKHGDVVDIKNPILPEMDGLYMVKGVAPYGGAEVGLRQEITIDWKINSYADIATFST